MKDLIPVKYKFNVTYKFTTQDVMILTLALRELYTKGYIDCTKSWVLHEYGRSSTSENISPMLITRSFAQDSMLVT